MNEEEMADVEECGEESDEEPQSQDPTGEQEGILPQQKKGVRQTKKGNPCLACNKNSTKAQCEVCVV